MWSRQCYNLDKQLPCLKTRAQLRRQKHSTSTKQTYNWSIWTWNTFLVMSILFGHHMFEHRSWPASPQRQPSLLQFVFRIIVLNLLWKWAHLSRQRCWDLLKCPCRDVGTVCSCGSIFQSGASSSCRTSTESSSSTCEGPGTALRYERASNTCV